MATKKKVKTAKKVASTTTHRRRSDQSQFLLIVAGGFLLIVLISISFGYYKSPTVKQFVQNSMDRASMKETIVSIKDNAFTSPVTVKVGTKVTWINSDTVAHSVMANDGSFNLGTVTKDQTKSYVFSKAGTYTYHSGIHEGMEGTIIVEE